MRHFTQWSVSTWALIADSLISSFDRNVTARDAAAFACAMVLRGLRLRLLLAPGELLQPLHQGIDLLVGLLALPPLHGLVLVLQPIQLQLEEVGQLLGAGASPPTTTASTTTSCSSCPTTTSCPCCTEAVSSR